jgi:hypothetical protein
MSETEQAKHSIGDEIPYRRDRIEKKTGSLVFDRHLDEKVGDAPARARLGSSPSGDNPVKPAQMT